MTDARSSSATRTCSSGGPRGARTARSSSSTPAASGSRSTATTGRRTRSCDDDGNVEFRRVDYDWQASADALRERYGDPEWVGIVTGRIERARLNAG